MDQIWWQIVMMIVTRKRSALGGHLARIRIRRRQTISHQLGLSPSFQLIYKNFRKMGNKQGRLSWKPNITWLFCEFLFIYRFRDQKICIDSTEKVQQFTTELGTVLEWTANTTIAIMCIFLRHKFIVACRVWFTMSRDKLGFEWA